VLRAVVAAGDDLLAAVLDFKRVDGADAAAVRMLEGLVGTCAARRQQVVLTRVRRGELLAGFGDELDPRSAPALHFQPQLELGLEWCERLLLQACTPAGAAAAPAQPLPLAAHTLCEGLAAADIAFLETRVRRCSFEPGAAIVRRGDPADGLFLLLRGEVSVTLELPQGGAKRLSTLTAGMSFGEMALVTGGQRSADVRADTAVDCGVLSADAFRALETERPGLMIHLLHKLLLGLGQTAVRLTAEVAALEA
jgi:glutaminase